MRKLYLFAAMAAMLASCSENDLTAEKQVVAAQDDGSITFDVYVNRGLTRAGTTGELTTLSIKNGGAHAADGFGVFAYYTDGEQYSGVTKPDFMYNQHVTHVSGTTWTYEPVKYWPNEFGSDAISDQVDRVSFFAYAPWVPVTPQTGVVTGNNTENITGMTRNNATGDPFIKYTATMDPTNTVDLCYAVAAEDFTSSNSTVYKNDIKKGSPYLNVVKPGLDGKIKFDFKHALAQLNVQVDAVVNAAVGPTTVLDNKTKIWVRSILFKGITQKGQLNLNDGDWYQIDASGDNKISSGSISVYDGRKDGKEPIGEASNETPATLNSAIIQKAAYKSASLPGVLETTEPTTIVGVTEESQNLFESTSKTQPVYVIPTGEKMEVTIVYDVETYDANLASYLSDGVTPGSTIQNSITKTIDVFGELKPGYSYTLNLHLGMKSVEFDAEVSPWKTSESGAEADLPSNVRTYTAAKPAAPVEATISSAAQDYEFNISGLNASEAVTATPAASGPVTAVTSAAANASGIATEKISIAENTTVKNRDIATTTWKGGSSEKGVELTLHQQAHALGLGVAAFTDEKTLHLTSTATGTDWSTLSPLTVKVKKNGVDAGVGFTPSSSAGASVGNYVLTNDVAIGDTYTITVKAGDADEETYVVRIGGINYARTVCEVVYGKTGFVNELTTIGAGTGSVEYTSSVAATATIDDATSGVVTTKGVNSNNPTTIKATATFTDANNWYYTPKTKVATYSLKVLPQPATIAFVTPEPTNPAAFTSGNYDANDVILDNAASLTGSVPGSDPATDGCTIAYSVDDGTNFDIGDDGKLKFKVAWSAGVSHDVTVTATVTPTANYNFTQTSVTYTITVTTE